MYTYNQVLEATLKYFGNNSLAAHVWADKYCLQDNNDNYLELTPDDMHKRHAKEFARIEAKKFKKPLSEKQIYNYFKGFRRIILQGSPLYGVGNPHQYVSLSNCYALPSPEDSYGDILRVDEMLVQISKRRGGVGIDLSNLRPCNFKTKNAAKTSAGIVSWMNRYSNSIREVGQCIKWDQRVLTSTGLKYIKDIKVNELVWTKEGWVSVDNVINNGKKQLYRLTTKAGYSVITSIDHIYQTFNNDGELTETKLSDLKVGDNIVLSISNGSHNGEYVKLEKSDYKNSNNKPDNCVLQSFIDEKLGYLLGYSYGDGYVTKDKYGQNGFEISCSNNYTTIKNKLYNIVIDVFNYTPSFNKGDGDLETLDINNKTIIQFLKHNNILKQKSGHIEFPQSVLNSPISVQVAFIAGYFDADGDIAGKKAGYRFRSICLPFLQQVQVLLSTFGILSKISSEDRSEKGWQTLYTLGIVGETSTQAFCEKFKQDSVKVGLIQYSSKRECWLTPFKAKTFGIKHNNYSFCPDNTQFLSLKVTNKLGVISTLVQDSIKSIEQVEDDDTYDLVLSKEHLFWCEGVYLHNSGRRGALMLTLSVHHPDILDFVKIKRDNSSITGANISVRLTNEFLKAVEEDKEYELRFPVDVDNPTFSKKVSAKCVWKEIIHSAWLRAEPGLLFWDNIITESLPDRYADLGYKTVVTNPCSEIPLSALDSCRLTAINLFTYVKNPFTSEAYFDYNEFYQDVMVAQRIMDDLVDLEIESIDRILRKIAKDPEDSDIKNREYNLWKQIRTTCVNGRRTGLGITALGDTIAALGIKYGSEESINAINNIYEVLKFGAYQSSCDMAKELGAFPIWDNERENDHPFLERIKNSNFEIWSGHYSCRIFGDSLYEDLRKYGRRNIAALTTAPTGTISLLTCLDEERKIFGTSSGIEPVFQQKYTRRKKGNTGDKEFRVDFTDQSGDTWMEFDVYHSGVELWKLITGKEDISESPYFEACAEDIDWINRVKLQAAAGKHICHSISSTINLPENVSEEKVAEIYETAWKMGVKGITVYRKNCRTGILVDKKEKDGIIKTQAPARPKELPCEVHLMSVKGKPYFALVGLLNGEPYEIFAGRNTNITKDAKSGKIIKVRNNFYKAVLDDETEISPITLGCDEYEEGLCRLTSTALRHGADVKFIVEQLYKIHGDITSFARVMGRSLKKYIPDGDKSSETCECGNQLVFQEGCLKCYNCGFSKCG